MPNTAEYNKQYYDKTKCFSATENRRLVMCPICLKEIQNWNMPKHKKTKKHLKNESTAKALLELKDEHKQFINAFNFLEPDVKEAIKASIN
jgi:hypothetical protein